MGGVGGWLLAVVAAALLCALAGRLMSPGPVKGVGQLTCGLVLLWAVLSPAVRFDGTAGRVWLEDYLAGLERREEELREQVDQGQKALIEREYAAYIADKAAEWGLNCRARVECRVEEGLYLPDKTMVAGAFSDLEQSRLTRMIQEDLGVPLEKQSYYGEEGLP